MKKQLYKGFVALLLSSVLIGCDDFLDKQPISDLTPETFWQTERDANVGVMAAYNNFTKAMSSGVWDWGEARSDNFHFYEKDAPDQQELVTNSILIDNTSARWTNLYSCIAKANAAIKYIPNINMDLAKKNDYLAEAYALRAWCYFYCVRVWGDVPLYTEPLESIEDGIYRERVSKEVILNQVILADLEKAYYNIDKSRGATKSKRTRINAATVCALLMDVYAWMNNYEMVIQVFEERVNKLDQSNWRYLVAEGGSTTYATDWRKMFFESGASESSPEAWFKLGYDRYGNGTNQALNYLARSTSKYVVSDKLRGQVYSSSDKRRSIQWASSGGAYRLTKKFWEDGTAFTGDNVVDSDVDLIMYRYPDAILLYAEALNDQGRREDAIQALNKTHARAGNTPYTAESFSSADEVLDAILSERQKEFVGEGKRWFDLVRTGRWATEIDPLYGMTEEKLVFPVHRDHLLQNPNLTQNFPAYPYP